MLMIGFTKSDSAMGRLIRWQTRSPWSHALLVYGPDGRSDQWQVIEAVAGKGVIQRPFDIRGEDHQVTLFRVCHPRAAEHEDRVIAFAQRQVGKPYDWTMVIRFVTRKQEARESSGKWFCSEMAYAALWYNGLSLLRDTKPWEVSPGLLARSPALEPMLWY